jgi:hypothetical protein
MSLGRAVAGWIASLVLIALATGPIVADADGTKRDPPASLGMLLRLHELPPGYLVDGEVGCSRARYVEGADPPLADFFVRYAPRECQVHYDRLYSVPGPAPDPRAVTSLAIDLESSEGVRAADAILPELVGRAMTGNILPTEVRTAARVGAGTRLFRTEHANALGLSVPGSLVTWRQGTLIGATLVGGAGAKVNDRLAISFARKQARHMRHPTPYPAKARDDLLVPLDNPKLRLPVFWLGRRFDAGGSRPLELTSAWGPLAEGGGPPGTRIELEYSEGALRIGTWTEATWKQYLGTKLGRMLLTWHCTVAATIPVPGGEATIYRGYPEDHATCPAEPPGLVAAVVHRDGVVLGINLPHCYICLEGHLSAAATEAVVRGLRLRAKPVF